MARKTTTTNSTTPRKPASRKAAESTAVRNSPLPKSAAVPARPSYDQIARRAYEIYLSGAGGGELDNWLRAERELAGQ